LTDGGSFTRSFTLPQSLDEGPMIGSK